MSSDEVIHDLTYTTRSTPNLLPHVVIGHKLHISFGNSSFSFDTVKRAWEDCRLFETFWSNSGYTPSDFYGGKGYAGPGGKKPEQGEKKMGGPPLGFYGRAILWDNKNILLGAHYAKTGRRIPVVAFLLDDNLTSVVKSQPLYLTLPGKESIAFSGRLVDLGRDGYFGYTHFYPVDETDDDEKKYGRYTYMYFIIEVLVFKLIRLQQGLGSDDRFLECQVVRRQVVAEKATAHEWLVSDAF